MSCCDGTGYTGKTGVLCTEHYEPNIEWFTLTQSTR